jgi:hypothetical protein
VNTHLLETLAPEVRRLAAPTCVRAENETQFADRAIDLLGDRLATAYRMAAEMQARHAHEFKGFRDWAEIVKCNALPAKPETVSYYLMALLNDLGDPQKMRDAARAIQFFHDVAGFHLDDAYIDATLLWESDFTTAVERFA